MTSDAERLAVLETKIEVVDCRTERIEAKLDMVIDCKADKSEVEAQAKAIKDSQSDIDKFKGALIILGVFSPVLSALITHWLMS